MTMRRSQSVTAYGGHYATGFRLQDHRWLQWLIGILIVILSGGLIAGGIAYHWIKEAPPLSLNRLEAHSQHTISVYDQEHQLLYTSDAIPYQAATVSQVKRAHHLQAALLSAEDRDFYHEGGVNYLRTLQSLVGDILHHTNAGGSTITQQLIKLTYYGTGAQYRTLKRKVQEMHLANELTRKCSKSQILTYYMNKVYLGSNVYGMETASRYYFGKSIDQLSINQAALLAGMVQQPNQYQPYLHYDKATLRRNAVLEDMYNNHQISQKTFFKLNLEPVANEMLPLQAHQKHQDAQYVQRQQIADSFMTGMWDSLQQTHLWQTHGIEKLQTSLNYPLQQAVYQIVNNDHYFPNAQMQCAITVINNQTGQVVAQVGGRHQTQLGSFNRACQMLRSSGSSIKPILDYGPAFDLLHWSDNTLINDAPFHYQDGTPLFDWDHAYMGQITAKVALYTSRNIPAVKAFDAVGKQRAGDYLAKCGLHPKLTQASAIGINTNPLQMAGLYTALANHGVYSQPTYLVAQKQGTRWHACHTHQFQLYRPGTSFMLTNALQMVATPLGTAPDAAIQNHGCFAGKSGTTALAGSTSRITDGWYIGYCKGYTVAVWTGYDQPQQGYMTNQQGNISQHLYRDVMLQVVQQLHPDTSAWQAPATVVQKGNGYQWKTNNVGQSNS